MKEEEIKLAFQNNQKFEFALIDDMKADYGKGNIITEEGDLADVVRSLKVKKGLTEAIIPLCVKIKEMSKELGADAQFKIASDFETSAKDRIKKIDSIISKISSI